MAYCKCGVMREEMMKTTWLLFVRTDEVTARNPPTGMEMGAMSMAAETEEWEGISRWGTVDGGQWNENDNKREPSVGYRHNEICDSTADRRVGELWEEGMTQEAKWGMHNLPLLRAWKDVSVPTYCHNSCFCPALHFSFYVVFLLFISFILYYFLVAKCLLYIL